MTVYSNLLKIWLRLNYYQSTFDTAGTFLGTQEFPNKEAGPILVPELQ